MVDISTSNEQLTNFKSDCLLLARSISPPLSVGDIFVNQMAEWVNCDACGKWRRLPEGGVPNLPESWQCSMNFWDPEHSKCTDPEDPAAHDPEAPTGEDQHEMLDSSRDHVDVESLNLKFPMIPAALVVEHPDFYVRLDAILFDEPELLADTKYRKTMTFPYFGRQPLDLYSLYHYTRTYLMLDQSRATRSSIEDEQVPERSVRASCPPKCQLTFFPADFVGCFQMLSRRSVAQLRDMFEPWLMHHHINVTDGFISQLRDFYNRFLYPLERIDTEWSPPADDPLVVDMVQPKREVAPKVEQLSHNQIAQYLHQQHPHWSGLVQAPHQQSVELPLFSGSASNAFDSDKHLVIPARRRRRRKNDDDSSDDGAGARVDYDSDVDLDRTAATKIEWSASLLKSSPPGSVYRTWRDLPLLIGQTNASLRALKRYLRRVLLMPLPLVFACIAEILVESAQVSPTAPAVDTGAALRVLSTSVYDHFLHDGTARSRVSQRVVAADPSLATESERFIAKRTRPSAQAPEAAPMVVDSNEYGGTDDVFGGE